MKTASRPTTALRQRMIQDLQLAGMSERTQYLYTRTIRLLAERFNTPPDQLTEQHVRDFFLHLKNDKGFSSSSLGVAYSSVKFFYSHTCPRDWHTLERLHVPSERRLPDVLSVGEVRRLIAAVRTPHNRAFFWTVYSMGLRLEEGLRLQVGDIDRERMLVHVHRGKGAKDRFVPLPGHTLTVLRQYWTTHRHPVWVFPAKDQDGQRTAAADGPMKRICVQKALRRVVQELKFQKRISIHSLRHSYATHLLEAGISLRQIQQYLGHSCLQTTMLYLHLTTVSQEQAIARIESLMRPE